MKDTNIAIHFFLGNYTLLLVKGLKRLQQLKNGGNT